MPVILFSRITYEPLAQPDTSSTLISSLQALHLPLIIFVEICYPGNSSKTFEQRYIKYPGKGFSSFNEWQERGNIVERWLVSSGACRRRQVREYVWKIGDDSRKEGGEINPGLKRTSRERETCPVANFHDALPAATRILLRRRGKYST